jgi:hypothetical protein
MAVETARHMRCKWRDGRSEGRVREHFPVICSTVLLMPVLFHLLLAASRCHYTTVNVSVASELA